MVRIDAATGEESAVAWIGDHEACFFLLPDCGGRKRKRDDAPAEDEAASSGVHERSGEGRRTPPRG
ncbi:putative inactive poly [Panicum miliaceum]|uniref:Inactive poly n=1 Tax=Panicum miliaceum TaxID=4540 RepID=A0A3L6RWM4_PANMI|nr:putative inactive poly [Panicum miliaceum]